MVSSSFWLALPLAAFTSAYVATPVASFTVDAPRSQLRSHSLPTSISQSPPALSGAAGVEVGEGVETLSRSRAVENAEGTTRPELHEVQSRFRDVAASFVPSKFNPLPSFSNRHLQTILGVFLRDDPKCTYVTESGLAGITPILRSVTSIDPDREEECNFWDERQIVSTPDSDFFHADIKYASTKKNTWQSESSVGMVVIIHGLESNSNSSLSTNMASQYLDDGFDVVCLNFRGCSGNPNDTLGGYHLGFTDDLRLFLKVMRDTWGLDGYDKRPIYLSGFSLGANVVLKTLGELGEMALTEYNVHGSAVTGAPFDLERNIRFIDAPGFNRVVYSGNFLRTLRERAQFQLDQLCESDPMTNAFDYPRTMSATSIADFDDAFIAPVYGFESNIDYYRQSSCLYFLDGIAVPTLIVNAGDDPFFDPEFFPWDKSVDGAGQAPIKMVRTEHGGHLGFLFHRPSELEIQEGWPRASSWMPHELGRFIRHVQDSSP